MFKKLDTPFSRRVLEQLANKLISRHSIEEKWTPSLPIPVEAIVEHTLQLGIEWAEMKDNGGNAWGGLYPASRTIRLNEAYLATFEDCPGLERFTVAHEIGHWELHIEKGAVGQPTLFDSCEERIICRDGDSGPCEVSANIYASFLLMPRELVGEAASAADVLDERGFRDFARRIGVSRLALHYRLQALGVPHALG